MGSNFNSVRWEYRERESYQTSIKFFNIGMYLASLSFPLIGKYLTFNIIITTRYSIESISKALEFFNSKSTRSRGNYFSPIYPSCLQNTPAQRLIHSVDSGQRDAIFPPPLGPIRGIIKISHLLPIFD